MPLRDELVLPCAVMDQEGVSIAAHPDLKGLPSTDRNHTNINPCLLAEQGMMCPKRPDCSVEVVEAKVINRSCAEAGTMSARTNERTRSMVSLLVPSMCYLYSTTRLSERHLWTHGYAEPQPQLVRSFTGQTT
jgi:hypothetical protein